MAFLHQRYGIDNRRMSIVRPPVDTSVFRPLLRNSACAYAGLDPQKRYWLFIGRFDDAVKRISTIISCFAEVSKNHPELELLIAGSGQDEQRIAKMIDALPQGSVRLLGWVADDVHKVNLLNAAECLVLASKREGFPKIGRAHV